MVWLPLSASAAVGAAVDAEFPVFPVVVESENTRVHNQTRALIGIIKKNSHRLKNRSAEISAPKAPGCHTHTHTSVSLQNTKSNPAQTPWCGTPPKGAAYNTPRRNKSYAVLRGGCWLASHTPFKTHTAQDRRYTDGSLQMTAVVSTAVGSAASMIHATRYMEVLPTAVAPFWPARLAMCN